MQKVPETQLTVAPMFRTQSIRGHK